MDSRDLLNVMAFTCDVALGKRDPVQRTVVKEARLPSAEHVKAPFSACCVFVCIVILLLFGSTLTIERYFSELDVSIRKHAHRHMWP